MPVLIIAAAFIVLLVVFSAIGLALWAFFSIAIVGVIVGGLARLILPGRQNVSILATILLGWVGSLVGGFLGYHVIHTGRLLTFLLEIGVSAVLIALASTASGNTLARRAGSRW